MEPSCKRCDHYGPNRGHMKCGQCLLRGLDEFEPTRKALKEENDELRAELSRLHSAPVAVEVPVVLDGGVGTIDMELVRIGYAWLDHRAGKEICSDRTCIRCRLADILAQVEKELALRSGEAKGRVG